MLHGVVCLTEITPKNSRYPLELLELQIPGYDSFTNVNDGSCHLGVIIYTRTKLHAVPSKTIRDFSESVWCEIPLIAQDRLLLGCIYRSPNSTEENTHILQESLSEMTTGRSHVVITGDFNQPDIDWSDNLFPKDPDCILISWKVYEIHSCANISKNPHTTDRTKDPTHLT